MEVLALVLGVLLLRLHLHVKVDWTDCSDCLMRQVIVFSLDTE
jgi:hypothetical protein